MEKTTTKEPIPLRKKTPTEATVQQWTINIQKDYHKLVAREANKNLLENELLEIIEYKDNYTQSDLQSIISAWVYKNCKY